MTFVARDVGSRLVLETCPGWKGFGKVVAFLWGKRFTRLVMRDMEAHALEMDDAWNATPW